METLARIAAGLLGATFAWAALAKLASFAAWRHALAAYRLPSNPVVASAVAAVELGVVALLLFTDARLGAALSVALLAGFSLAILRARAVQGDRLPCGCFGRAKVRDYRRMLLRNSLLGVLAALVLLASPEDESLLPFRPPSSTELIPVALALVGVALLLWVVLRTSAALKGKP